MTANQFILCPMCGKQMTDNYFTWWQYDDGTKERWYEVCKRVIEGMYSVQKNWAKENRLPWNDNKAQKSAQEDSSGDENN